MSFLKRLAIHAVLKVFVTLISLTFCFGVFLRVLLKWYQKGNKYWYVKERTLPPLSLQDPALGRHSYVTLKDVKIHYVENGDRSKPLMLFVHGFPEFWFSWRHQLKHFASDYWVVAMDLRGYGDSDKPSKTSQYNARFIENDIVQLIKALRKDKCILVGHDWGGVLCWAVARKFPDLVEKLVILNAPHPLAYRKKLETSVKQFLKSWYIFAFQMPYLPELYCQADDIEFLRELFGPKVNEEELEAYKFHWGQPGAFTPPINYYRNAFSLESFKESNKAKDKVIKPTLIIWGKNDIALSSDLPELTKPFVNDLKIVYIENGNHFIQQDQPKKVNEIMEDFLTKG